MKTPREILLQRHQATQPQLDQIRREVLNTEFEREGRRAAVPSPHWVASMATLPQLLWRELVWPCRRTWAGLAATWLVLLVFNFAHFDRTQVITAKSTASPTEMRFALQEQQRLLLELVGPTPTAPPAKLPRSRVPLPRSERHGAIFTA
jgi:hypothetical protein